MTMGQIIKTNRERLGLTQEELGAKVGVNKAAVQKWESGKVQNLKRTTIQQLAQIFEIAPSALLGLAEEAAEKQTAKPRKKGVKIPVLGDVAAGIPIEAIEDIVDYEEIDEDMARGGDYFGLRIKGDSMEPRMVTGDVVIVRQQPTVDSGDIAVVLVNGDSATVKKVKITKDGILLIPFNSAYEPMFYSRQEVMELPVTILGKVVELRAKF